jgi:hypothetical protein
MAYLLSLLAMFGGQTHLSHTESITAFAASKSRAPFTQRHAEGLRAFAADSARTTGNVRHRQSVSAIPT